MFEKELWLFVLSLSYFLVSGNKVFFLSLRNAWTGRALFLISTNNNAIILMSGKGVTKHFFKGEEKGET